MVEISGNSPDSEASGATYLFRISSSKSEIG